MFQLIGVVETMLLATDFMPLPSELVAREDDFRHRQGPTAGALLTRRPGIPMKAALAAKSFFIPLGLEY
jgi:hypothetical protein